MGLPKPNSATKPKPIESIRTVSNEKLSAKDLNKFLNHHGISIDEFAKILGVTNQAVRLWTSEQREFSVTNTRIVRLFQKYPQLIKEF